MMDRHTEELFLRMRRELTYSSDDETIQRLPPMIILGETEKRSFDRKHFCLNLTFRLPSVKTGYGYLLIPDEVESLHSIQKELDMKEGTAGLYVSERTPLSSFEPFKCTHQKLVLIKPHQEGFLLMQ